MSRAGRAEMTGVDRVERAYLDRFLDDSTPFFVLVRSALGVVLLDRAGAAGLAARLSGAVPWGAADLAGRLSWRSQPARARAEADLRRLALARAPRRGLARMLRAHLPRGAWYFNTGHSHLEPALFAALHRAGLRVAVMLHDTIPLDHAHLCAPGSPARFARKFAAAVRGADLVICNSEATRADVARHAARLGRVPPMAAAPLGVTPAPPAALPPEIEPDTPYFVALGTIEPRKNHALLLDVWQRIAADPPPGGVPRLVVAGRRGWRNTDVFRRLDALAASNGPVAELPGLSDGAVSALLRGACALVFPSLAEGYGLPPLEAAALGTPVIASDLPVLREQLGDFAVYLPPTDSYAWQEAILRSAEIGKNAQTEAGVQGRSVPGWAGHFNTVLSLTV
ncbi:glycosyltransferase family 4 protein [Rhodovulum iodosum]|uniref:glycosyltransferase family 4 protein n=1 Tax=Rhodovulum iodosum TaxID=68291 RepID=UPI0014727248|nr:glycosyltransferase family 1 protein [Rhodovulum robiginosum]